jgi:hypothetical protein
VITDQEKPVYDGPARAWGRLSYNIEFNFNHSKWEKKTVQMVDTHMCLPLYKNSRVESRSK